MIRKQVRGYIGAQAGWFERSGRRGSSAARARARGGESHCVESRARRWSRREPGGRGSRSAAASALRRRARIGVISTLAAFAVWLVAAASASAFSAQGSAEQVYVTGLAPNAQMSLLNSQRRDRVHAERRLARRAAVPERAAGQAATGFA